MKRQYDKRHRDIELPTGSYVLRLLTDKERAKFPVKKLAPRWSEPLRVLTKLTNGVTYNVQGASGPAHTCHVSHLLPLDQRPWGRGYWDRPALDREATGRTKGSRTPAPCEKDPDSTDDEDETVVEILVEPGVDAATVTPLSDDPGVSPSAEHPLEEVSTPIGQGPRVSMGSPIVWISPSPTSSPTTPGLEREPSRILRFGKPVWLEVGNQTLKAFKVYWASGAVTYETRKHLFSEGVGPWLAKHERDLKKRQEKEAKANAVMEVEQASIGSISSIRGEVCGGQIGPCAT
jgi:hypothetical protein